MIKQNNQDNQQIHKRNCINMIGKTCLADMYETVHLCASECQHSYVSCNFRLCLVIKEYENEHELIVALEKCDEI